MGSRKREFLVNDDEILQILDAQNSDDENNLILDAEDKAFLEDDIDNDITNIVIDAKKPDSEDAKVDNNELNNDMGNFPRVPSFQWSVKYRPVVFTDIECHEFGKVLVCDMNVSKNVPKPIDVFLSVMNWSALLKNIIVPETVRYAQQKGIPFNITPEEMEAFLGMNMVMSYHILPTLRNYWSSDPDMGVPYLAQIMTVQRFEDIRTFLHFSDNNIQSKTEDCAFKIRTVMNHLNARFLSTLNATKYQAVDEHMIRFKGHNIMRQCVKSKPIKWGFKMWCWCDSKTGYLFEFDLYTGKKSCGPEVGLGEGVVLQLTEKIAGLGCEVYINNFFNSPTLQFYLSEKNIKCCGTVRPNIKRMPKNFSSDRNMKREVFYVSSNGISTIKWMDNKGVYFLSNFISPLPRETVKRRISVSQEKIDVTCPLMMKKYNSGKGGVDLMDQKKITYEVDRKFKIKYYLRLFFDLLDIGVNNSCIVYNEICKTVEEPEMSPLEFRQCVARSLIGQYSSRKRAYPGHVNTKKRRCTSSPPEAPQHKMTKLDARKRCAQCAKERIENRTNNICELCNVYLCYTTQRNCFLAFHNQ